MVDSSLDVRDYSSIPSGTLSPEMTQNRIMSPDSHYGRPPYFSNQPTTSMSNPQRFPSIKTRPASKGIGSF